MDWSGVKVSTEVQNGKKSMIRINDMTMDSASMFVCSGHFFFFFFLWGGKNIIKDSEASLQKRKERKGGRKAKTSSPLTHLPTHSNSETQTVTRERKKKRKGRRKLEGRERKRGIRAVE